MASKIEMSFHPIHYDISWLEERFDILCTIKEKIDMNAIETKIKHATLHPKIIYKFLGRHNRMATLFVQNNIEAIKSFLDFQNHSVDDCDIKTLFAYAVCITGPLKNAKLLIESLKHERTYQHVYVEVLQLFECFHLTFFDREVYGNTPYNTVIDFICDATKATIFNDNSYNFSLQNNGLQTETLLQNIKAIVSSLSKCTEKEVDCKEQYNSPLFTKYDAYFDNLRSHTLITSNEKIMEKLK